MERAALAADGPENGDVEALYSTGVKLGRSPSQIAGDVEVMAQADALAVEAGEYENVHTAHAAACRAVEDARGTTTTSASCTATH